MSRHNIKYQFNSAIEGGFRTQMDKHALKHAGQTKGKVFSFPERKNLCKLSHQMHQYLKTAFPGVRMAEDITAEHWNMFLKEKASTCSQSTIRNYVSRINKMQDLVNRYFKVSVEWRGNVKAPESEKANNLQRTQSMEPGDFQKIREYGLNSRSRSAGAVELAGKYGHRAGELSSCKIDDINLVSMKIHIKGKGGRERWVDIRTEDLPFLQNLLEKAVGDKVFGIKPDSINRYLLRTMTKLDIKEKYPVTSIHSIRKMAAQNRWDELRAQGLSKKEAGEEVSKWLGHGKNRSDIISVYIKDRK